MRIRLFPVLALVLLVAATPLTVTVPAGTHVHFKLLNTIDTATAKAGQHVPAALTEALVVNGVTVAKAGAPAEVRIRNVESSGRIGGSAKLSLTLASITLANGQTAAVKTSSWSREGKAHAKHNATYIVGGAVVGALAGQAIGHDRDSTAKGAAAGAGAGIGAAAITGKFDFQVAAGDRFSLRLRTPLKATL
jgi:hypothetical protein